MDQSAFDNVESQIGACGIWCGSCAVGNGSLRLASQCYFEVLESHGFEHWAPPELDYQTLSNSLSTVSDMASCPGCHQGGGRADCQMKTCSAERRLSECSECDKAECPHAEILDHMRSGALKAGLFIKTQPGDSALLIEEWTKELANRFPSSLLFLQDPKES